MAGTFLGILQAPVVAVDTPRDTAVRPAQPGQGALPQQDGLSPVGQGLLGTEFFGVEQDRFPHAHPSLS